MLSVGMKTGGATVEISRTMPENAREHTYYLNHLYHIPKEFCVLLERYMPIHVYLFTIARILKQPRSPSNDEWTM